MKLEKEVVIINGYNNLTTSGIDFMNKFTKEELEFLKKENFKKTKLILEVEEPILDDAERKYLSDVIRPFRNSVKDIIKRKNYNSEYEEYIVIHCGKFESIVFPYFKKGTMYKGMESNKEYTLEELGL